jgi:hypothetical protein
VKANETYRPYGFYAWLNVAFPLICVQKLLFIITFNPNQKKLINFSEEKMISAGMVTGMEAHRGYGYGGPSWQ